MATAKVQDDTYTSANPVTISGLISLEKLWQIFDNEPANAMFRFKPRRAGFPSQFLYYPVRIAAGPSTHGRRAVQEHGYSALSHAYG
jgi:hypothetical protein